MSAGPDILEHFAEALMQPDQPPPQELTEGLTAQGGPDIAARFGVYRNNVFASLIGAMKDSYPVVARLVGEAFFTAMAREFIQTYPPQSPVLLDFGHQFPEFLEVFEPVAGLAYLPDTARLEAAWLKAYHAADAAAVTADEIASIAPDRMAELRFELHPAFQTLNSRWPVRQIWEAHQGDHMPETIDLSAEGGELIITRPSYEVFVIQAAQGTTAFARALGGGEPLGRAAELTANASPGFDLTAALAALIGHGAFTRLHCPPNPVLKDPS